MQLFRRVLFFVCGLIYVTSVFGSETYRIPAEYVLFKESNQAFEVVGQQVATICVDPTDWKGVRRAVSDLSQDIFRVTGRKSDVVELDKVRKGSILVGTIGKSVLIDQLIRDGKLDVSTIKGQWESFLIQTIDDCLVIAGSDKRGTIYGIYDVSERIGVSPWYWWADVPVQKRKEIYVKNGLYIQDSPKVKYRGIFINDEEPSFGGWARTKFGGINSKMYAHMFELLLRLKANYLWPA
ncbi:MAG: glycosyl hydrolase 115 family protein, partial [Bacteroidales bacterium]|nr:glycosyl hydrolase 115 family protein [Bacteroidales bacterium]